MPVNMPVVQHLEILAIRECTKGVLMKGIQESNVSEELMIHFFFFLLQNHGQSI